MPMVGDETARLRELHEDYAWEINAAVAEGREDLIAGLMDDFMAAAVQQMAHDRVPGSDHGHDAGHGEGRVRLHAGSATRRNHWWPWHRK